ncbi:MAG: cyclic nucleotide-binding domain-containing protein [Myxococcota bacterium]
METDIDDEGDRPSTEDVSPIGLFGCLDEHALNLVVDHSQVRREPANSWLYRQGERGTELFVILDGEVLVGRDLSRPPMYKLGPGDWFGEVEVLNMTPRRAEARTSSAVRLLVLDNRTLAKLYRSDLKMYALLLMNLARQLARKLHHTESRL